MNHTPCNPPRDHGKIRSLPRHRPHLKHQHAARTLLALEPAHGGKYSSLAQDVPPLFVEFRANDEVGETGLILQGDEGVTLGGGRALVDDNQSGDFDHLAIVAAFQVGGAEDAGGAQVGAVEAEGMVARRKAQEVEMPAHALGFSQLGQGNRLDVGFQIECTGPVIEGT